MGILPRHSKYAVFMYEHPAIHGFAFVMLFISLCSYLTFLASETIQYHPMSAIVAGLSSVFVAIWIHMKFILYD